ncbi:hypothetical protein ElyMa_005432000, partial [Elysia marginata]
MATHHSIQPLARDGTAVKDHQSCASVQFIHLTTQPSFAMVRILANGDIVPDDDPRARSSQPTQRQNSRVPPRQ